MLGDNVSGCYGEESEGKILFLITIFWTFWGIEWKYALCRDERRVKNPL